jgi:hypothetical protein
MEEKPFTEFIGIVQIALPIKINGQQSCLWLLESNTLGIVSRRIETGRHSILQKPIWIPGLNKVLRLWNFQ